MASGLGFQLLHLPSGPTAVIARLHPVVLFNICDSFIRRNDGQDRVIGTLLGTMNPDGSVEIKNSYAVPHNESSDQVAVDIEYHKTMFDLNKKVNSKELIVGWYSTGSEVSGSDALIQDFYARETPSPIHLTVDTTFSAGTASLRAYVSVPLSLGDRQLAAQFQEVDLDLKMVEAERVGFENLKTTMVEKIPTEFDGLESSVERLRAMVDDVFEFVDGVVEGRISANHSVGRQLSETLACVPKLSSDSFEKLFNDSIQDMLLVLYLANLTRTQLALAEKLNTAAQPI